MTRTLLVFTLLVMAILISPARKTDAALVADEKPGSAYANNVIPTIPLPEPPPDCSNIVINSGFEGGTIFWTLTGQVSRSKGAFPHSGVAYMVLNGANSSSAELYQTVQVPTNGCSNLSFWLNVTTTEAAGAPAFDKLFVEIRSNTGALLTTLATFSNQNGGTAGVYQFKGPYNLSGFAGQQVRIQFRGTNDVTLPTTFRIDDVVLQ